MQIWWLEKPCVHNIWVATDARAPKFPSPLRLRKVCKGLGVDNGRRNSLPPDSWTSEAHPCHSCVHYSLLLLTPSSKSNKISISILFHSQDPIFIASFLRKHPSSKFPSPIMWFLSQWGEQHLQEKTIFTCSKIVWQFTTHPVLLERQGF